MEAELGLRVGLGVHVHVNPTCELTLRPWEEVHFTNEETEAQRDL